MKNWKDIVLNEEATILNALEALQASALQAVLIANEDGRLKGVITDGDIRRTLLNNRPLSSLAKEIMCTHPTVGSINDDKDALLQLMVQKSLQQIPILDSSGKIVGMETLLGLTRKPTQAIPVVIMAGGLGSRLMPLTSDCPKPLLKVGQKPIMETILENFIKYGFSNFFISINYRGEMIEKYFQDGSQWGVSIQYIKEDQAMGTAGALTLMPKQSLPIITMNGDLLTKVNFKHLLEFHQEHKAHATMCVREYESQIPFGVVSTDGPRLLKIEEKPTQSYYVNAGIYILNPDVLDSIDTNTPIDMPTLFSKVIDDGGEAAAYPIREYWMDIGRLSDYERANNEYGYHFSDTGRIF